MHFIRTPCPADWSAMPGTEKVRFCDKCQKNVHDLTESTPAEIETLRLANHGDICGRIRLAATLTTAATTLALASCSSEPPPLPLGSIMPSDIDGGQIVAGGIMRYDPDEKQLPGCFKDEKGSSPTMAEKIDSPRVDPFPSSVWHFPLALPRRRIPPTSIPRR